MNPWISLSIEYANQRSYLDDLFQVYPTIPEGIRDVDKELPDYAPSSATAPSQTSANRRSQLGMTPFEATIIWACGLEDGCGLADGPFPETQHHDFTWLF